MIVSSGIAARRRRAMRQRTLIVAHHDVIPDGERLRGDLSLHLPQRVFAERASISWVSSGRLFRSQVSVRSLQATALVSSSRLTMRTLARYSAAVVELRRRQMPATIFVAPGIFRRTPWWDLYCRRWRPDSTPEGERDFAMIQLAGRGDDVLDWARGEPSRIRTQNRRAAHWHDRSSRRLRSLMHDGLSLGSHSPVTCQSRGAERGRTRARVAKARGVARADICRPLYPVDRLSVRRVDTGHRASRRGGWISGRTPRRWRLAFAPSVPYAVRAFAFQRSARAVETRIHPPRFRYGPPIVFTATVETLV